MKLIWITNIKFPQILLLLSDCVIDFMQDARAAGTGYKKSKKRRVRGPTKLIEPRREADRPALTPINVE